MAKFRKRSQEVEAVQYAGDTEQLPYDMGTAITRSTKDGSCFVDTDDHGNVECRVEDWIVRDAWGNFSVWKTSDLFEAWAPVEKYPDCPTVEIDLNGALFDTRSVAWLNQRIAELSPHPKFVNVLIRRLYALKGVAWERMPEVDEPSFTVLGRDQLAQNTVVHWIERARVAQVPEDKIRRAMQRYQEIVDWQSENPDKVKTPD